MLYVIVKTSLAKQGWSYASCEQQRLALKCSALQGIDNNSQLLAVARKLTTSLEILLWMTPSEAPKALQASECSELLDPMRASCWISAQH